MAEMCVCVCVCVRACVRARARARVCVYVCVCVCVEVILIINYHHDVHETFLPVWVDNLDPPNVATKIWALTTESTLT